MDPALPVAAPGPPTRARDRRQLQQIIAGLTVGVILIEPGEGIIWANVAALAMHGVADLATLGATVDAYKRRFTLRYRNNHELARADYPLARALKGETFADVEVEVHAKDGEQRWVHSVCSLTITDSDGQPDCFALIIADVTDRYEAEARFNAAFNANPAPAIILRLADLRYVRVNQGFVDLTDLARDVILTRSFEDFDVLSDAQQRDLALARLSEGRTIPQMEARLPLPSRSKFVLVAGQPIEIDGGACMLFTFADLDPQKQIEAALRQSERRFTAAFRLAPAPMAIAALDRFRLIEVNDAFRTLTGHSDEALIGQTPAAIGLWSGESQRLFDREIGKGHGIRGLDLDLKIASGDKIACLFSAEAVAINDERQVLCVLQDVAERRRTEAELIAAIEQVMADASWFSRGVVEKLATLRRPSGGAARQADLEDLSARELDVLGLICEGCADPEISAQLKVSRNTVRNHLAALYRKIGVNRRAGVIVWARERGITGKVAFQRGPKR